MLGHPGSGLLGKTDQKYSELLTCGSQRQRLKSRSCRRVEGICGQGSVQYRDPGSGISAGWDARPRCVLFSYVTLGILFRPLVLDFFICKTGIIVSAIQYCCRDEFMSNTWLIVGTQ